MAIKCKKKNLGIWKKEMWNWGKGNEKCDYIKM